MAAEFGVKPAEADGNNAEQQLNSAEGALEKPISKKPRPRRPNYHEIHAKPLPVDVYPLPAFIPHNPISIVRIAINLLSHSLFPPNSHPAIHAAYFSTETQSIHVTDAVSIRALWEQGFWGKGSLSRSEPQWLVGEKKKRGIEESKTSAEVTQSRREERKQFKLERARAQREAIEQQLRQEGKLDTDGSVEELVDGGQVSESPLGTIYDYENGNVVTAGDDAITSGISKTLLQESPALGKEDPSSTSVTEIEDQEHLQLTLEEAFYLSYALGALSVHPNGATSHDEPSQKPYLTWYLFRLFAAHASSPVSTESTTNLKFALHAIEKTNKLPPATQPIPAIEPDNPFILRYVVFHHFRTQGY